MDSTPSSTKIPATIIAATIFCLSFTLGVTQITATEIETINANKREITFEDCPRVANKQRVYGAKCGILTVAENPDSSVGKQISLHIMRLSAVEDRQLPPIFFVAGGPGQASTEIASMIRQQFSSLLKNHDFVFVDQRGTGKSNPLDCETDPFETMSLLPLAAAEIANQQMQMCINSYDSNLSFYTTPYAVKDLEQVRLALGYPSINVWGASYGTRVILEYLRQFPNSVHRVVLDGVAPVAIELPAHVTADSSQSLAKVFEHCREQRQCEQNFSGLRSQWLNLLASLKEHPQQIELKHPRTEQKKLVYIDDVVISSWVRLSLYVRDLTTIIPLAINNAINADFSMLYSIHALGLDSVNSGISQGMQFNILCSEDNQFRYHQQPIEQQGRVSLLSTIDNDVFDTSCEMVSSRIADPAYFEPLQSNVPALLLSGEIDPATPPHWAELVQDGLTQSQHIIVPGGHHNVSGLGCIPDLIQQFYSATTATHINTDCIKNIMPASYFIDSAGPGLLPTAKNSPGVNRD
ncbi:MAG: alpha/beta fold hydrolase [Oceanicoccus sp.]